MSNLWCKLWNFFLNIFTQAVHAIAYAVKTVGEIAIGLASDLLHAVGSALGPGNFFPFLLVGVGAYFLLTHKKDDKGSSTVVLPAAATAARAGGPV